MNPMPRRSDPALAPPRASERGVAFIIVLTVLMALMVLAAPFLSRARDDSARAGTRFARAETVLRAEQIARYARHRLMAGHRTEEARRALLDDEGIRSTPDYDLPEEALVSIALTDERGRPLTDADGKPLMHYRDPRGVLADLDVRDESALPNLHTAPAFLLAAVLGRSTLSEKIDDAIDEISVEDASAFAKDGGTLYLNGELISYDRRQGNTFYGCSRGLAGGRRARQHPEESWVLDDRARQIAMLPFRSPRARGGHRETVHATYVKELALSGIALRPHEVDRLLDGFTTVGERIAPDGFGPEATITGFLDPSAAGEDGFVIPVASVSGINPGSIVRLRQGQQVEYHFVCQVQGFLGPGRIRIMEVPSSQFLQDQSFIAPLMRHPINVNAATEETLTRVLDGVQLTLGGGRGGGNTFGRLGTDGARDLAKALIAARPLTDLEQMRRILEEHISANALKFNFTGILATGVFRNMTNPLDNRLVTSTVPFSWTGSDHYRLDVQTVRNDGSGRELARHRLRELVHLAPPGLHTLDLRTQRDFEDWIVRGRLGRWVATHPRPTSSFLLDGEMPYDRVARMLYRLRPGGADQPEDRDDEGWNGQNGVFPDPETGDVRLLPVRMSPQHPGFSEHFDGPGAFGGSTVPLERIDPEGFRLTNGPFEWNPNDARGARPRFGFSNLQLPRPQTNISGNMFRGSLLDGRNPAPVRVDMWYRMGAGTGGRHVLFDFAGQDPDEDRITFVREDDGSLRGRIHGRTLDDPSDDLEEWLEVVVPPGEIDWRSLTWYHLGFAYRGTRPTDSMIFVDGMKAGTSRYMTRLSQAFAFQDLSFAVENADNWPTRGVARIGAEVVSFVRSGNSFDVVSLPNDQSWGRGRRGTKIMSHPQGTPVELFGYSILPRRADAQQGVAIPRGGATLRSQLGPLKIARFEHNVEIPIPTPPGAPPRVLQAHDPNENEGSTLKLVPATEDWSCFPADGGYILIISNPGGNLPGRIELAQYQSRAGNQLLGLSDVPNPPNPALANQQQIELVRERHPVLEPQSPNALPLSCVMPISIAVDGAQGLMTPEPAQAGGWDTEPEFVQVGQMDLDSLNNHRIEWIRYHHVDPSGGHLLMDELGHLNAASGFLRGQLMAGTLDPNATASLLAGIFPQRSQVETWRLWNGDLRGGFHSSGSDALPGIRTASFSRLTSISPLPQGVPTGQELIPDAPVIAQAYSAAGYGDRVTIEDDRGRVRIPARVAWSGIEDIDFNREDTTPPVRVARPRPPTQANNEPVEPTAGMGWIALDRALGRDLRQNALPLGSADVDRARFLRILKFPSGELPLIGRQSRVAAGGGIGGEVVPDAQLDELRVTPFISERFVVWDHNQLDLVVKNPNGAPLVDATTTEIPIANVDWMLAPGAGNLQAYHLPDGRRISWAEAVRGLPADDAGLVRIGEEIIAFRRLGTSSGGGGAIVDCERGFMGTTPTPHGAGEEVVFLDFIPVSMLNAGLAEQDILLQVQDARGFQPTGGTVLVGMQEMIHYSRVAGSALVIPPALSPQGQVEGALFRGRFGTPVIGHNSNDIVFEMPFRYWDRFAEQQDSAELSWYGLGLDKKDAFFHRLVFEEVRRDNLTDIVVMVKTDPRVRWDADPRAGNGLFVIEDGDPDEPAFLNVAGDGLDLRVMFRYLGGAYDPFNRNVQAWKSTPELRSLQIQWLQESRVLSRETGR